MKTLILLIICHLFLLGCGSQDYASRPEDGSIPSPSSPQYSRQDRRLEVVDPQTAGQGVAFDALEWMGFEPKGILENVRCSVADGATVAERGPFSTALLGGAIIGLIVRVNGAVFFGQPPESGDGKEPSHGHDGHGGHGTVDSVPLSEQFFWQVPKTLATQGFGAALGGGLMGLGCQMVLTGAAVPFFPGVLGADYSALSAALVMGAGTAIMVKPWVRKAFGEKGPLPKKPTKTASLPENPDEVPAKPGKIQRVKDWAHNVKDWSQTSGFSQGVWYDIMPGLAILGVSSGVGVLVYDKLQDNYLPMNCTKPEPQTPFSNGVL